MSGAVWCAPAHPARPQTHASLIEEGPVLLTPPKPDTPLDTPIRIRPLRFVLSRLSSLGPPSLTPGQSHDLALANGLLANVVHVEAWKVQVKRSLLICFPAAATTTSLTSLLVAEICGTELVPPAAPDEASRQPVDLQTPERAQPKSAACRPVRHIDAYGFGPLSFGVMCRTALRWP